MRGVDPAREIAKSHSYATLSGFLSAEDTEGNQAKTDEIFGIGRKNLYKEIIDLIFLL